MNRKTTFRGLALAALIATQGALGATAVERAQAYQEEGKTKAAVIELKNALQADPGDKQARLLLGRIYLERGDGASAEKELRRARSLGIPARDVALDLGRAYLLQGKIDEVAEVVRSKDWKKPSDLARAHDLLGLAALGRKDLAAAEEHFEKAIAADPHLSEARLGLIQTWFAMNAKDKAAAALKTLVEEAPDYIPGLLLQAEWLRQQKANDAALALYDRVLAKAPDNAKALMGKALTLLTLGRKDEAAGVIAGLDKVQPGHPPGVEYLHGLLAFMDKDFEKAATHLQKVLRVSPRHLQASLLMGVIAYTQKEYQTALEYLTRVQSVLPGYVPAAKVLAATYLKLKQPKQAVSVLEPLLGRNGRDAQLLALLGSAYMLAGERGKGTEMLQRAVEQAPDVASLRTELAVGLLSQGDAQGAVGQLQSAVDLGQGVIQADVLLVLAQIKEGKQDQALASAKAFEQRLPDSPVPYNLTGLVYLSRKQFDKAERRFRKSLEIDPKFVTASDNLGRVALARKHPEAAKEAFEHALEIDPKDLKAMLGLAAVAQERGDEAATLSWLEKAKQAVPQAIQPGLLLARHYLRKNQPLKALNEASRLNGIHPDNRLVLSVLAEAQRRAGDLASAIRNYRKVVEAVPSADGWLRLGVLQLQAKQPDVARDSLRRAIKLGPKEVGPHLALGALELKEKNLSEALHQAREAQRLAPKRGAGFALEARVLLAQGKKAQAAKAWAQAYTLERNAKWAVRLADLYRDLGKTDKAIALLEDELKRKGSPQVRLMLATVYQGAGRKDAAIGQYERLVAGPGAKNPVVLNNLAWLYFKKGDHRAKGLAARAYEVAPDKAEILDTYGWILLQQGGDPAQALELLQRAHTKYPTQPEIGFHLARAQFEAGQRRAARNTLTDVLAANPRFPQRREAEALLQKLKE